ncbi:hypothetical protein O3V59_22085 [Brevibacillus thermoruber]|uniref:Uncharacterized protein n=1 Tax=Brevibacillus thermoruber TaxID=33942 RepID=A0A9X3TUW3_9BACL|nr:hypothetical protein [Brevibacillus thermoruber]MDA5111027.1 hypothetical protein [Brevibacillus thermoruber]
MSQTVSSLVEKKRDLKRLIQSIFEIPDQDSINNIKVLIQHLNHLLRVKSLTPPLTEIMILLKEQKPFLYHATRLAISKNSHLTLLFEIKGDPKLAAQRLEEYLNKL